MALGAALVDRARLVTQQPMTAKVEGTTRFSPIRGPWFKARLQETTTPAVAGTPDAAREVVIKRPQLLCGRKDGDGNPIVLSVAVQVEVDSRELGKHLWEVTGDPEPLRKRRTVIGWQADLRRVDDHEAKRLPS